MTNTAEMNDFKYNIRLLFKCTHMGITEISKKIGVEPTHSWKLGENRITPTGTALTGKYTYSMWNNSTKIAKKRKFADEIRKIIDIIEKHEQWWSKYSEHGGTIDIIVECRGSYNVGDLVDWNDLGRMAKLKISLGFEIFP